MKTTIICSVIAVCPFMFFFIARKIMILRKRPVKEQDLKACIETIRRRKGCSRDYAYHLFSVAYHIVEFYGVSLKSAGYSGTIADLADDAGRSVDRYEKQAERYWWISEIAWSRHLKYHASGQIALSF